MSYLVVGKKSGGGWAVEVQGVGTTTAAELSDIESSARALLRSEGRTDADDADLQLLMPDFEVDLDERGMPRDGKRPNIEMVSGLIALIVVVGAIAYVLGRIL